jgi:hypothetical protein
MAEEQESIFLFISRVAISARRVRTSTRAEALGDRVHRQSRA